MARSYKNARVQGTSSVSTYSTLYTTSASATAVISTISVCNTASADATFRIAIMDSAGTPAQADFISYGSTVAANDTSFITVGITMSPSQFIRISSSANTVSFCAFISEIT